MAEEKFNIVMTSALDEDTASITSFELSEKKFDEALRRALSVYDPENKQYSVFLNETASKENFTVDRLNELAPGLQSNLQNILSVNAIVQTYINKNDLIGITYDAIEANVNTEYKCYYKKFPDKRNKSKTVENAKEIIDDFNEQINVRKILRTAIPLVYAEGTYIMYLRKQDDNYVVDSYPLGVAEISDYTANGKPIVLINMSKLKSSINKTMLKDRKRRPLFFNTQEEEIKATYPPEVYDAYKAGDAYAKLDVDHCGVVRIGNLGRKYGVTPFFRALFPTLMLETFDNADRANAKAKSKKIIWQKLRKEVLGPQYDRRGLQEQVLAHDNLMKAWKQSTVVVTTPAYSESIEYVEPKVEMTNIETVNQYRNRVMAALGISFLNTDGTQTVSTANISLDQLLKTINKAYEQIEDILKNWYRLVLQENRIGIEYCPDVKVSASELMSIDMKKSLSAFVFNTLGASRETAYGLVGLSVEDEQQKRERENSNGFDEIFAPRLTSFTASSNGGAVSGTGNSSGTSTGDTTDGSGEDAKKVGRPRGEATEKQAYDKARNDAKKMQGI